MSRIRRFRQHHRPQLPVITDAELRNRDPVFLCHFRQASIFQRFAVRHGRVGFHYDIPLPAVINQIQRTVSHMAENLVHHGFHTASGKDVFKISLKEIGNTDCPQFPGFQSIFKSTPYFPVFFIVAVLRLVYLHPGLGRMNNHHIQISKSHRFQCLFDGFHGGRIAFIFSRYFGCDKDIFPVNAAGADSFSDTTFIAVRLCRINMAVSDIHRRPHSLRRLVVINKPGTQRQFRNGCAIMQRITFLKNHNCLLYKLLPVL